MYHYLIAFGASEGNRSENIQEALAKIQALGTMEALSQIISTPPYGGVAQGEFLNGALILSSDLSPETLMTRLLGIEAELGRERMRKWSDRPIDLDLILEKSGLIWNSNLLTLPHPEFHKRSFVLIPAGEIAPDWIHPVLNRTVLEIWGSLEV
ncbi:MAG: 2-amino-4-hydroxy-6-hydroxymethyldihydropteridine diphosphokinase [Pseudomonadota bacterium]